MNQSWNQYIEQMPKLLDELLSQPIRQRGDKFKLPKKGIYVFYENGDPIYVGRTRDMLRRLNDHCRSSSRHNSATFAFMIAKREAEDARVDTKVVRRELEINPIFSALYTKAKERVSRMPFRVVQVDDPILQTLFEVYASISLGTDIFNDFETH